MSTEHQAERVVERLRKQGVHVIVDDMEPRPWEFTPNGVLLHHTASSSDVSIAHERSDVRFLKSSTDVWPAPRVQWYVGRTGRVYLISKGAANHAGTGNELMDHGIPKDMGNKYLWGIEVQSAGLKRDFTKEQWKATHALTGELILAMPHTEHLRVWRHKDYDNDSGKIDTQYPLEDHREAVRQHIKDHSGRTG